MKRRSFLKKSASALAAGSGPFFLNMTAKAGSDQPVVGTREHRYECNQSQVWRWYLCTSCFTREPR